MIWIASEVYYPDEQATGVFMTKIAQGLAARGLQVGALTSQPANSREPTPQLLNGVKIYRSWSTRFNKNHFIGRIVNLLTISLSSFIQAMIRIKRKDVVLVVTSPPTLPMAMIIATRLKQAKCIIRIDDVYPDVLHACNVYNNQSKIYHIFDRVMRWMLRKADSLVVIGRDMQQLIANKLKVTKHIKVISNWADTDCIQPMARENNAMLTELGLESKLVLQWAGNMGYPHDIATLYAAMERLNGVDEVHFLIIGAGAKRPWLEKKVKDSGLTNVTFLGLLPREQQQEFLNACDIGLSSLVAGMVGVAVPSRSYNILAAGKPILAIGEPAAEISQLISEHQLGWVVAPGAVDCFVETVTNILQNRSVLQDIGRRARHVAETEYSANFVIDQYQELLKHYSANASLFA